MRLALALLVSCCACSSFSSANEPDPAADAGTDASTGPTPIASDHFDRARAADLGNADVGGAWTLAGSQPFSVVDGMGSVIVKPGKTGMAFLESVDAVDVDAEVTYASQDFGNPEESIYMTLATRRKGEVFYGCVAIVQKDGDVVLSLSTGPAFENLIVEKSTGLNVGSSDALRVHFVTRGTSPTKLACRVWKSTSAEPEGWHAEASDANADLQTGGDIGLRVYVSSSATVDTAVRFDDFLAQPPQ